MHNGKPTDWWRNARPQAAMLAGHAGAAPAMDASLGIRTGNLGHPGPNADDHGHDDGQGRNGGRPELCSSCWQALAGL